MARGLFFSNHRFCWNVEAHVGPNCPNRVEDVQLVQLGYYCCARNPNAGNTPAEQAAYNAVVPGSQYTGSPTDPLSVAIREHQRARGGTQDGRVSPIPGNQPGYGPTSWMIVPLSNNIYDVMRDIWPALHKSPQCPPALAAKSKLMFNPD